MRLRLSVRKSMDIAALLTVLLLMSLSFSIATPEGIAGTAQKMLASSIVGVGAGVSENPYNTLAQQLSDKELELLGREERLMYLEENVEAAQSFNNTWALTSVSISAALLLLVGLNYYLDWKRGRRRRVAGAVAIDLRRG